MNYLAEGGRCGRKLTPKRKKKKQQLSAGGGGITDFLYTIGQATKSKGGLPVTVTVDITDNMKTTIIAAFAGLGIGIGAGIATSGYFRGR